MHDPSPVDRPATQAGDMETAQALFIGNVFWWTGVSVILGLLVRMPDPDDAT